MLEAEAPTAWAVPPAGADVEPGVAASATDHPGRRVVARYHLPIGQFKFKFDYLKKLAVFTVIDLKIPKKYQISSTTTL
jgi:hypothetical protein